MIFRLNQSFDKSKKSKMNLKNYKPILELFCLSIVGLLIHKLFFYLFKTQYPESQFYYSLQQIYLFFFCSSSIIITVLIIVKQKSIDNVGYVFLLLTSIKMVVSYAFLTPILNSNNPTKALEKINFFIIFALFLAIETIITIRILNKNQKKIP